MKLYNFDNDNNNVFTVKSTKKYDFGYHINTFPYPFLHGHEDYWEFTILTQGHLKNVTSNETVLYEPHTLFYCTTNDSHKLLGYEKDEKIKYINFIIRESRLKQIVSSFSSSFYDTLLKGKKSYHFSEFRLIEIEKIVHRINTLDINDGEKYEDYLCSAMLLILQFLYFANVDSIESENPWVNTLNKKMNNASFLKYNVEQLCEELKCSRMHLNRFIKQYYSMTPHQFLLNYKLSYAHNLLLSTDMSIKQIFETIGYDSFSSFSKNFQEKYGLTPYKFKQTNKI